MTNLTDEQKVKEAKNLFQEKFPEIFVKLATADSRKNFQWMADNDRNPFSSTRFSANDEEILRKIETGTWTPSDEERYCKRTNFNGDWARNYWITVGGLLTEMGTDLKEDLKQVEQFDLELVEASRVMIDHNHYFGVEECGCTRLEVALIRFGKEWSNRIATKLFIAKTEIEAARTRLTVARKLAKRLEALKKSASDPKREKNWASHVLNAQSEQNVDDVFEAHRVSAEVS